MKKVFALLILAISFVGCELEDDERSSVPQLGPIEDVTMPARYKVDSVSKIVIRYRQPSTCHIFTGFYYERFSTTRTVAIQFNKLNRNNCEPLNEPPFETELNFEPQASGAYTFKFWTGFDEAGAETYITEEVVVP
ncbi:MAG: hypothetical protein IR153_03315 [Flavobacterium sp.]|nr:hypothetical protein [Flavobacterium sp.]